MRKQYIPNCTRKYAEKLCPWYAIVVKAGGGYWVFESMQDYYIYKKTVP